MTKNQLLKIISNKIKFISKREVEEVLDTTLSVITETLQKGERVTLTGFGAFSARLRRARFGVSPRDPQKKIEVPAMMVPKFTAGKNLKEALKARCKLNKK